MKKGSINSFANHAPKLEWVRDFFEQGKEYWEVNGLGPNQVPMFKKFLRESGVIDKNLEPLEIFDIAEKYGWENNLVWGLMLANLAYNNQFKWYVNTLEPGMFYERATVSELLIADGVKKNDATSIINAFKRFCELPIGTSLGWGSVVENGRQIDSIVRSKCYIANNEVVLYSLLLFSEKCNDYKEFTLSWMMNDSIDRDGISPTKIFDIDYEEMKSILLGLSSKYPEYINATFTNDLEKITIQDKNSDELLRHIKEAL